MNVGYTDNIPATNNDPSDDQPLLQENTNSTRSIIEVDHLGFTNNLGGYHDVIRQPYVVPDANPTTILNVSQLYSRQVTPDSTVSTTETQLFHRTGPTAGTGAISQLTGFKIGAPLLIGVTAEGYQWLGGILIQWGVITNGASSPIFGSAVNSNVLIFKDRVPGMIPFPNNLFTVYCTLTRDNLSVSGDLGSVYISGANQALQFNNTRFNWKTKTPSGLFNGFTWFAIGN